MAENKENDGFVREVSHRLFAAELKESNLQVGTLTETEDMGNEAEFWRGRTSRHIHCL